MHVGVRVHVGTGGSPCLCMSSYPTLRQRPCKVATLLRQLVSLLNVSVRLVDNPVPKCSVWDLKLCRWQLHLWKTHQMRLLSNCCSDTHTHARTHACTHTYAHKYAHAHAHSHTHTHTRTHARTRARTHTHSLTHSNTHSLTQSLSVSLLSPTKVPDTSLCDLPTATF